MRSSPQRALLYLCYDLHCNLLLWISRRWFCHVDDDNYVNLKSLLSLLSAFSHSQDIYIGRPSLDHPIEAADHLRNDGSVSRFFYCWFSWTEKKQILVQSCMFTFIWNSSSYFVIFLAHQHGCGQHFPKRHGLRLIFEDVISDYHCFLCCTELVADRFSCQ